MKPSDPSVQWCSQWRWSSLGTVRQYLLLGEIQNCGSLIAPSSIRSLSMSELLSVPREVKDRSPEGENTHTHTHTMEACRKQNRSGLRRADKEEDSWIKEHCRKYNISPPLGLSGRLAASGITWREAAPIMDCQRFTRVISLCSWGFLLPAGKSESHYHRRSFAPESRSSGNVPCWLNIGFKLKQLEGNTSPAHIHVWAPPIFPHQTVSVWFILKDAPIPETHS